MSKGYEVNTKTLRDCIMQAKRAVSPSVALPALSSALITFGDGHINVQATDLGVTFRQAVMADYRGGELGDTLVDIRALNRLLPKVKADTVHLSPADDGGLRLTGERLDVTVPGHRNLDDFPGFLPALPRRLREVAGLPEALRTVLPAAGSDEARPILSAVAFDGCNLAATDSYRLVVERLHKAPLGGGTVLVPAATVKAILQAKPARLKTATEGETVTFVDPDRDRAWTVREVEGSFPNYQDMMPTEGEAQVEVEVDRKWSVEALDRIVALTSDGMVVPVTLEANGTITYTAGSDRSGKVTERVEGTTRGGDIEAAYNPRFLRDLMGTFDTDTVTLEVRDALKPLAARHGDTQVLLMPMRVN